MSKHGTLTRQDVERYALNPEFIRYLETFRRSHGLEREQVRVLDFGCGRGEAVFQLRAMGWDALGADIDPAGLENGRAYLRAEGHDTSCLLPIGANGRIDVPDGHFQFVFSETVLEHVRDLETVASELSRILAAPGAALHAFPAQYHVVEQHLGMPFVHWLPKNALRTAAISLCVTLHIEPGWVEEGWLAKVRRYTRYSNENTFYRPARTLRATFERHGFRVGFVSVEHPKLQSHPLVGRCLRLPPVRACIAWLLLQFKTVELHLVKGAVKSSSGPESVQ